MAEKKKLNIKDWATEDRPREKMLLKGPFALSDSELIAILIGSGNPEESAVELSRKILGSVENNLSLLGRKNADWLKSFKGIGEAKAVTIMAALELGRRRKESEVFSRKKIESSKDVADYFIPLVTDLDHEEFWVMFCNRSNKIIDVIKLSQGGLAGTVVDVRLIMKSALEKLASSIVLCHNHPSGNLEPSAEDKKITQKVADAAKLLDIKLLDHLIIALDKYFSFNDGGLID